MITRLTKHAAAERIGAAARRSRPGRFSLEPEHHWKHQQQPCDDREGPLRDLGFGNTDGGTCRIAAAYCPLSKLGPPIAALP